MNDCIFCKIASKQVPKDFTYEEQDIMVFPDIHPKKPVHLLIVPKKHIREFLELEDDQLLAKIAQVIKRMAKEQGLDKKGYRVSLHGGGFQEIDHLHVHLMGPMGVQNK